MSTVLILYLNIFNAVIWSSLIIESKSFTSWLFFVIIASISILGVIVQAGKL